MNQTTVPVQPIDWKDGISELIKLALCLDGTAETEQKQVQAGLIIIERIKAGTPLAASMINLLMGQQPKFIVPGLMVVQKIETHYIPRVESFIESLKKGLNQ